MERSGTEICIWIQYFFGLIRLVRLLECLLSHVVSNFIHILLNTSSGLS